MTVGIALRKRKYKVTVSFELESDNALDAANQAADILDQEGLEVLEIAAEEITG